MATKKSAISQDMFDLANEMLGNDGKVERASFKRFKKSDVYKTLYPETAIKVYETLTEQTATYDSKRGAICRIENRQAVLDHVEDATDSLDEVPTSVHDLAGGFRALPTHKWLTDETFMRQLFHEAAKRGVIKEMEIKTCGVVAIRLYYI